MAEALADHIPSSIDIGIFNSHSTHDCATGINFGRPRVQLGPRNTTHLAIVSRVEAFVSNSKAKTKVRDQKF